MKYLSLIDILGPVLTTLAAIIALAGDPYNKNGKWYSKLNLRGKIIASLVILSVIISFVNTYNTNETNEKKLSTEKGRFDSLKLSYDYSKQSVDSLNRIIDKLNENLIIVQNNELKEQRRLYDERTKIVFQNLYNEIVYNTLTYEDWNTSKLLQHVDDEKLPGTNYTNKYLNEVLTVSTDDEFRTVVTILIRQIDNLNFGIEQIRFSPKGSEKKRDNIQILEISQNTMKTNLDELLKRIKLVLPYQKAIVKHNGRVIIW